MSKVKHESDKKQKDLTPLGSEFPVPSPVEGSWTKRLRTLVQNAGVDKGSVQYDESEADQILTPIILSEKLYTGKMGTLIP